MKRECLLSLRVRTLLLARSGDDVEEASVVQHSLFGPALQDFLGAILLGDLRCLVADFACSSETSVNFSHIYNWNARPA